MLAVLVIAKLHGLSFLQAFGVFLFHSVTSRVIACISKTDTDNASTAQNGFESTALGKLEAWL